MKKLVLHIGGPKCGSSTLQRFFGANFSRPGGVVNLDGDRVHYAAIAEGGGIVSGKSLSDIQSKNPFGYVPSVQFSRDPENIYQSLLELKRKFGGNDVVVLSNEGWGGQVDAKMASSFERLGVPVEVFLVARPPVDWVNASWWQWGCWTTETLDQWVESIVPSANFLPRYRKWSSFAAVGCVSVVDLSQDIVNAAARFLRVDAKLLRLGENANVGTNFHLLRHLVNNKEKYGRTIHAPRVEFHLNKVLDLPRFPPPFVVPQASAREIIARTKAENEKLIESFSLSGRGLSDAVRRKYLDEHAYDDIEVVDVERALAPAENDEFIGALVGKVLKLASYR